MGWCTFEFTGILAVKKSSPASMNSISRDSIMVFLHNSLQRFMILSLSNDIAFFCKNSIYLAFENKTEVKITL
jgi:hypothetical protein